MRIKRITFSGIKNTTEDFTINFIGKKRTSIKKSEELDKGLIKGIYGPNGSGKTTLVETFSLYKYLVSNVGSSLDDVQLKYLYNETVNNMKIEIEIFCKGDTIIPNSITHTIEITRNAEGAFFIHHESFQYNEDIILEVINGKIVTKDVAHSILNGTYNMMKYNSLISIFKIDYDKDVIISKEDQDIIVEKDGVIEKLIRYLVEFNSVLMVYNEQNDNHITYLLLNHDDYKISKLDNTIFDLTKLKKISEKNINFISGLLVKMQKFLKIFKPSLQRIEFVTKLVAESNSEKYYDCEVFFIYDSYKVTLEYESAGIKKLVSLFIYLKIVSDGGILIIDEFDAHLHDVATNKMIEYFRDNEMGQLIFTTHNVTIMDTIKNIKKAITIIDLEGNIFEWTQSGNKNPINAYKLGAITNDFGYSIFDFEEAFDV